MKQSVLVIDDDPAVHQLLAAALEAEGYDLRFANNGAEGLRLARELKPAVITLDVIMPEMDGYATLAEIQGDPGLRHIPVIMISSFDEMDSEIGRAHV